MKFFFEFVYCCGYPYRSEVMSTATSPPVPTTEESPTLSIYCKRSRNRGRLSSSRSGSAADWRPSLNAIYEENVPAPPCAAAGSEKLLKRKVSHTSRNRRRYYTHEDTHDTHDDRRAPFPAIIPAFSPTPFLF